MDEYETKREELRHTLRDENEREVAEEIDKAWLAYLSESTHYAEIGFHAAFAEIETLVVQTAFKVMTLTVMPLEQAQGVGMPADTPAAFVALDAARHVQAENVLRVLQNPTVVNYVRTMDHLYRKRVQIDAHDRPVTVPTLEPGHVLREEMTSRVAGTYNDVDNFLGAIINLIHLYAPAWARGERALRVSNPQGEGLVAPLLRL